MSDADPSPDGPPWEEDAPDGDVAERDPDTDDMFGSPEPAGMREAEAAATDDAVTNSPVKPVKETASPVKPTNHEGAPDSGPAA
ncbi:MAG: hypothetical protein Q8J71_11545, partial [Brevundimonas sp.]|nr:hypothetical protein [Brevundimonas sp.]